ncbi:MAG: UDP-N-acetylmuramate dehydrogenase [Treponema sp.]|nr:UDP-N-acetylmuramate dehydrogenase [Treponema sp.]
MYNITQVVESFKQNAKIGLFFDEVLANHSSFKIGGKAALLAEPSDAEALAFALTEIKRSGIPYFVLGGGTNVLFNDAGFDGIVVSTKKLSEIDVTKDCPILRFDLGSDSTARSRGLSIKSGNDTEAAPVIVGRDPTILKPTVTVIAAAGASMASLVSFAQENALSGLEEFAGLPGTVGGAVYMNARCFEKEISQVVQKIQWLEWDQKARAFVQKEAAFAPSDWAYKKSPFMASSSINGRPDHNSVTVAGGVNNLIVTSVEFPLYQGCKEEISKRAAAYIQARKDKGHYKAPCAGSVFKNNHAFGRPTGKIIDELGLKGKSSGRAQIAPFHGNIIINNGGAKASDVLALIDLCKKEAKAKFGFDLEEEIVTVE